LFHHPLEFDEALKGNADREFDALAGQGPDDRIAEEVAVHADFDEGLRQDGPHRLDTGQDERLGSLRVMHITRAKEEIEDLSGLGDRAEQGVIAARVFLFLVESFGFIPRSLLRVVRHSSRFDTSQLAAR
jgi:hypothetical protein